MLRNWLRRVLRLIAPPHPAEFECVLGLQPGFVWDPAHQLWVHEDKTWEPGIAEYSLIGPIYRPVGLNP